MSIAEAIVLGLVQGLTEFIPVSSSGHLILADTLLDLDSTFSFDVVLNIGTLLALIMYYRRRLWAMAAEITTGRNKRLLKNIVLSTIPAVVVGGLFADLFAGDDVRNLGVVVTMLIVVGVFMIIVDTFAGSKKLEDITPRSAVLIGLGQALALIPGTSRSGATILAGKLNRLSYEAAADYSFLIAIPIVAGALVRSLFEQSTVDLLTNQTGLVLAGVGASALSGWLAIGFMLRFLKNRGLKLFGIYRIVLGIGLLLFVS